MRIYLASAGLFLGILWILFPARPLPPLPSSLPVERERIPASPAIKPALRSPQANLSSTPDKPILVARLQAESSRPWLVSWAGGTLIRLAGSRLELGERAPRAAATHFFRRFAPLLGVQERDLAFESQRQMGGNVQLLYAQTLGSLPVFNSRINLIFDGYANLIYLSSNVYAGTAPSALPALSSAQASAVAAEALARFRAAKGDNGPSLDDKTLGKGMQLGYRLMAGNIALVYKFNITIPASPLADVEIFLDAESGGILQLRSLARS